MATFRIHRMKAHVRLGFRFAPHISGVTQLKPRDYEEGGEVEGSSFYDVWSLLRGTERALEVGDVLETPEGAVRICKYVGFEEARWVLPEAKPAPAEQPAEAAPAGA